MEVKPGYKQTEVGQIPEDWNRTTIREIATKIGSGVTPTGGSRRYKEYGRPFVRSQNVGWGRLQLDDLAFIDEGTHNQFPATELKRDDVLLNITGASIGRTALADESLVGGNVNQHVCIIRSDAKRAVPRFVNLMLLSALGQRQVESFQAGGNRQGLNFAQIASIELPLPPTKAEQEAIAEALSDADGLIESLERLTAKKRKIEQGVMQELLTGKRRLPGFEARPGCKHTDVGAVPEDWDVKTLADLFTFQNGVNADKSAYGSGVAFINVLEVITYQTLTESRIPGRVKLSPQVRSTFAVQFGDVLFNRTSETQEELGLAAVYRGDNEVVFGGFVIRARPRTSSIDPSLASYLLRSPSVRAQIVARGQGVIRANIGQRDLARVQLPLPAKAEQKAIATVLTEMDTEIAALDAKLAKARQLKHGMMQELLTGRTRLI
jgi:type I restriction enzyme, S subunit